jgi:hypothetical protein
MGSRDDLLRGFHLRESELRLQRLRRRRFGCIVTAPEVVAVADDLAPDASTGRYLSVLHLDPHGRTALSLRCERCLYSADEGRPYSKSRRRLGITGSQTAAERPPIGPAKIACCGIAPISRAQTSRAVVARVLISQEVAHQLGSSPSRCWGTRALRVMASAR